MSVYAGPKISQSDLVLSFDQGNSKSWKGAPTTNINSGQGLGGMQTITLTYVGLENEWKKYSISGTWNAGTYPFSMYISGATFTGGVAYSAQCLMRTNVRHKFASFSSIYYVNDPNMTNGGTYTSTSIGYEDGLEVISNKVEGFIYSTGYANPTTSQVGYLGTRPLSDGTTFNSGTDFVWVKDVQVEQGTFCTTYTPTARSNTQSILDLTGNRTLTISNLTYNANNTFSFDGVDDYITSSFSTTAGQAVTYIGWLYSTESTATYRNFVDSASTTPMIWWNTSGQIEFDTGGNYTTTTVYRNQWVHVALSKPSGSSAASYYVNGNLVGTGTAYTTPAATATWFNRGGGQTWKGHSSNVQAYNRALTAAEIQQNFNALRSRFGI
jgi:hypothetical protein